MNIGKEGDATVSIMFEELKQTIAELNERMNRLSQCSQVSDFSEITLLAKKMQEMMEQKDFTDKQFETIARFTAEVINRLTNKIEGGVAEVKEIANHILSNINAISVPPKFTIVKEHKVRFTLDFNSSKAAITMIVMAVSILFLLGGNIWQSNQNTQFQDNDLKYRYIRMIGKTSGEDLSQLEDVFTHNRDKKSISVIRKRVETYESLVKEQAEKIERARQNATKAEKLQKEAESLKEEK